MIYLILTILFSSGIIVIFRLIGNFGLSELQSITFNYFFAVCYGLLIWGEPVDPAFYASKPWFLHSLLIGVFFIITFFLLSRSTITAGVSVTAVASRISVLIPVTAGFILFGDRISVLKITGIILALFSFYLVFKKKGEQKIKIKKILLPLVLFIGIGTNDTFVKYIEATFLKGDETMFLTVVFFVSFLIGTVILGIRLKDKREKFSAKNLLSGFLLGSLNFSSGYFFIKSMAVFETSVLFPVVNISIVVLTAIIGLTLFKERLSRLNWIGIVVAMLALLMITTT